MPVRVQNTHTIPSFMGIFAIYSWLNLRMLSPRMQRASHASMMYPHTGQYCLITWHVERAVAIRTLTPSQHGWILLHPLLLMLHPATVSHLLSPSPPKVPDTEEQPLPLFMSSLVLSPLGYPVCFWWLSAMRCFRGRVCFRSQAFWGDSPQGKWETRYDVDPPGSERPPTLLPSTCD